MKDPDLEAHFKRIVDELRGFDPFAKKIARLKSARLSHIIGVCEDIGGGYSYLKLQGSGEDKLRYLTANVGRDVRVTLHRAHLSEGLFELRGFPRASYNPANAFRLCTYTRDGEPAACVLTSLGNVDFRLSDPQALKYLNLLEHTLKANPELRRAFDSCFLGSGRPLRLFFNKQLEVDYAKANLTEIYRDIFRTVAADASHRNLVKPVLNFMQTAVSFSYLPANELGDGKLFTQMSILHDLRALEPLRKILPALCAEMSKRAFTAEAPVPRAPVALEEPWPHPDPEAEAMWPAWAVHHVDVLRRPFGRHRSDDRIEQLVRRRRAGLETARQPRRQPEYPDRLPQTHA